ncbi:MAG: hypothetical protein HUK02_07380 [Bacteroidaceae bacterium]|nr:hypothetical protein [Bacteroidaceae bacterium]
MKQNYEQPVRSRQTYVAPHTLSHALRMGSSILAGSKDPVASPKAQAEITQYTTSTENSLSWDALQ